MVQTQLLAQLVALEHDIAYFQPPPPGKRSFKWIHGRLPILISAPHATAHIRRGQIKGEEEFTAALAQMLAKNTGAHALYTQYASNGDPNWDQSAPYKAFLRQIVQQHDIRFLIDLHGMSNRHNIGLAIGTINGRSCPQHESIIALTLQAHQFIPTIESYSKGLNQLNWQRFVINHSRFTGGVINHTVTRFAQETLGINAVQIELCASLRVVQRSDSFRPSFTGSARGIAKTYRTLANLIHTLAAAV